MGFNIHISVKASSSTFVQANLYLIELCMNWGTSLSNVKSLRIDNVMSSNS